MHPFLPSVMHHCIFVFSWILTAPHPTSFTKGSFWMSMIWWVEQSVLNFWQISLTSLFSFFVTKDRDWIWRYCFSSYIHKAWYFLCTFVFQGLNLHLHLTANVEPMKPDMRNQINKSGKQMIQWCLWGNVSWNNMKWAYQTGWLLNLLWKVYI